MFGYTNSYPMPVADDHHEKTAAEDPNDPPCYFDR